MTFSLLLRALPVVTVLSSLASLVLAQELTPHAAALPNSHQPGEVDRPELLPLVVADPRSLYGITLDETQAELIGEWQYSTHTPPYVGIGYLHDRKSNKGKSAVVYRTKVPISGKYEVRVSHCYNVRRAKNTPITVNHADGSSLILVNQQAVPEHEGLFRSIGVFRFDSQQELTIRISNEGTEGKYVIADAVQLLPAPDCVQPKQLFASSVRQSPDERRTTQADKPAVLPDFTVTIPGTKVRFKLTAVPARPAGAEDIQIQDFWIGTCEVTWAEYHEYMKLQRFFRSSFRATDKDIAAIDAVTAPTLIYDPMYRFIEAETPMHPANTMTRFAARQYTKWLSLITGLPFRLPTEQEWEYACLANSDGPWSWGGGSLEQAAQYCHFNGMLRASTEATLSEEERPSAVGQLRPNEWGIYDMHGNVAEWVVSQQKLLNHLEFDLDSEKANWLDPKKWDEAISQLIFKGGCCRDALLDCRADLSRGVSDEFWNQDPAIPASSWWFASEEGFQVGFRVVCSPYSMTRSELEAFWGPDHPALAAAVQEVLLMGGVRGQVDDQLPGRLKSFSESRPEKAPWEYK